MDEPSPRYRVSNHNQTEWLCNVVWGRRRATWSTDIKDAVVFDTRARAEHQAVLTGGYVRLVR